MRIITILVANLGYDLPKMHLASSCSELEVELKDETDGESVQCSARIKHRSDEGEIVNSLSDSDIISELEVNFSTANKYSNFASLRNVESRTLYLR